RSESAQYLDLWKMGGFVRSKSVFYRHYVSENEIWLNQLDDAPATLSTIGFAPIIIWRIDA
ncbi:hypothetical protein, partial [Acidiphilium sp.]|uniref:hypothetical protein n=1 Tax=Acidiphilium sp. TaxID=527 RepID=UPI003CFD9E7F